jgi:hypothetical protein
MKDDQVRKLILEILEHSENSGNRVEYTLRRFIAEKLRLYKLDTVQMLKKLSKYHDYLL